MATIVLGTVVKVISLGGTLSKGFLRSERVDLSGIGKRIYTGFADVRGGYATGSVAALFTSLPVLSSRNKDMLPSAYITYPPRRPSLIIGTNDTINIFLGYSFYNQPDTVI
jgi:hypothetical protein